MGDSVFDSENFDKMTLICQEAPEPMISNDNILMKVALLERGKTFGSFNKRNCIQTKSSQHIYDEENSSMYMGSITLLNTRCSYNIDDSTNTTKYEISFSKNLISENFVTKDDKDIKSQKKLLEPQCIQTDFHSKYKTLKILGEGAFGSVYKVQSQQSSEIFAAKQIDRQLLTKSKITRNFLLKEISVMKEIDHPSVSKLYEIHETKNSIYLLLNYLDGGELFEYLRNTTDPVALTDACLIMKQCLEGQDHLASKNIIHMDIKPENLVFKYKNVPISKNQIVICDFGLSTYANDKLDSKVGTPGFIAPEILNPEKDIDNSTLTTKIDIFSMGIIFYIQITGEHPFYSKKDPEILANNKACEIKYDIATLQTSHVYIVKAIKNMTTQASYDRISAKDALELPLFSGSNKISDLFIKADYNVKIDEELAIDPRIRDVQKNYGQKKRCSIRMPNSSSLKSLRSNRNSNKSFKALSIDSDLEENTPEIESPGSSKSQNKKKSLFDPASYKQKASLFSENVKTS